MKKYSLLSITLASALSVSGVFAYQTRSFASELSNLKEEQKQVEDKNTVIESTLEQKNGEISEIEGKEKDIQNEIKRIDTNIATMDQNIRDKQEQIEQRKTEIEKVKKEIILLKQQIKERDQILNQRARAMQTSGQSINYLDVILGANSIGDLIDRVAAVTTIVNADKDIINDQKKDQIYLEEKERGIERKLAELEKFRNELQVMKKKLDQQKLQKTEIMNELWQQKQKIEKDKLSLGEEQAILYAQESAIKKAIQIEEKRVAEEKTRENEIKVTNGADNDTSSGIFIRPTQGYISSEFGNRSLDGFHSGMDIAKSGTVPIVASSDGVVSRSYLSSSYGNAIFITHSINGRVYTTVYAHMRSRVAIQGETIKKGQIIGYMGNTGISFGQHLHFEIHKGSWNVSKSNAVNPRKYINF